MLQEKIKPYFRFEIIKEFKPHLISFGFANGRSQSQRINALLNAIIITNLCRFSDEANKTSDYQLVLSYPETPDQFFFISIYDIYSTITLQSGNKFEVEELVGDELANKINSGFYNKKTEENRVKRAKPVDNKVVVWTDSESLPIAYPYKDGLRELRLDEISYNPSTKALYFKCFCYMRKQGRTFKADTFNDQIIFQGQEYTLKGFLSDVLCISPEELNEICQKIDQDYLAKY